MKALEPIWIPNLRAFEKGVVKPGMSGSFLVKPGEVVEDVMRSHFFTEEEVNMIKTRILRGNPKWVSLDVDDSMEVDRLKEEKERENKRKLELAKLNRKEQTEMLKKLGVKDKEIPHFEVDKLNLIYELEMKKKGFFE